MISDFIDGNTEAIIVKIYAIFLLILAVIFACLIDLFFGIRKAKQINEYRRSELYRRTVTKGSQYIALMLLGGLLDFANPLQEAQFVLFKAPLITAGFAIGLIRIEYLSVKEKAEDKLRRKLDKNEAEATKRLSQLMEMMDQLKKLENKDDV